MEQISIVIPVYNAELYISRCIKSIINQTFKDYIVYLIDDCSNDSTYEIISSFAKKDNRFLVYRNMQNAGPSSSRNLGIEKANGKYITFVDADDWYCNSQALEILYKTIINENVDCVTFGYNTIHKTVAFSKTYSRKNLGGRKTNREFTMDRIYSQFPGYYYVWNKIYNFQIIKEYNIRFQSHLHSAEDVAFNQAFVKYAKSYFVLSEVLYSYDCTNCNSLTHRNFGDRNSMLSAWNNIIDRFVSECELCQDLNVEYCKKKLAEQSYKKGLILLFSIKNPKMIKEMTTNDGWNEILACVGINKYRYYISACLSMVLLKIKRKIKLTLSK